MEDMLAFTVAEIATQWRFSGFMLLLLTLGVVLRFTLLSALVSWVYFVIVLITLIVSLYLKYSLIPNLVSDALKQYHNNRFVAEYSHDEPFMIKVNYYIEENKKNK